MTPNTIEFKTTSNTLMDGWVMRITADRGIEVNEDVNVTEAAKKVLEAMQLMLDKQKRTWVGLTDEQKQIAIWTDGTFGAGALWAEAKLKDKNNG
jgi:hypothetical protein